MVRPQPRPNRTQALRPPEEVATWVLSQPCSAASPWLAGATKFSRCSPAQLHVVSPQQASTIEMLMLSIGPLQPL